MWVEPVIDLPAQVADCRARGDSAALLACLDTADSASVRRLAVEALAAVADAAAFEALGARMARPPAEVGDLVLDVLHRTPGSNSARLLARGLGADDPLWRNQVLEILADRPEPEVLSLLLPALRDRSGAIRQSALRHARRIVREHPERAAALSPEKLGPVLESLDFAATVEWFRSSHPTLRCAAASRLGAIGGEVAFSLLAGAAAVEGDAGEAAFAALESAQDAPAAVFRTLAAHPGPVVRRRAVVAAAARTGPDAAALVAAALEDPEPAVREAALRGVQAHLGPESLPRVAPLVGDAAPGVRATAVDVVARWPGEVTDALLGRAAGDGEPTVRRRALLHLARRGGLDPVHVPALAGRLREIAAQGRSTPPELDDASVIASCFGKHPDRCSAEAIDALVAGGDSSSLRLRRVSVEALQALPPASAIPAFARLADTRDKSVLKIVGLALGAAGAPEGLVPLIRVIDECGGRPADQAKAHLARYAQVGDLDCMIGLLENRWVSARRYSAERLREAGDERAVPPLLEALADEDVEVQLAAVSALGRFASRSDVADRLVAAVEYGDLAVRQSAIEALGEAHIPAAVPILIRALGNAFLRTRAETALKRIGDRKGFLAVRRRKLRDKYFKKKKATPAERARAAAERKKPSQARPRRGD